METQKGGRRKRKKARRITSAGKEIDSSSGSGWLGATTGDEDSGKKLSLTTSSKDYDGNLGLPEKVAQRKYETTGQFFRRLERLVAKARVEASLESRFDVRLSRREAKEEEEEKFKKAKRRSSKLLDSDKIMLESSRKYRDKRRKRYGR